MQVLLAVDESTAGLRPDDRVFADALEVRGVDAVPHRWGRPVAPGATVVVRSTWDYVDRPAEFATWLDHLDDQGATVLNPTSLLRWNTHKRYLVELERAGVPIVPTELVDRGSPVSLDAVAARRRWVDVVVKPAVGGTARLTVHAARVGPEAIAAHFDRLVEREDVLVQPFVPAVLDHGEVSVIAIAGTPLAAIVKRAAPGDWRVQSDFGGTATAVELTADLRAVAEQVLAATPSMPVYARIDVLPTATGWSVLEVELVEPELFFPLVPSVAAHLADAVVAAVRH